MSRAPVGCSIMLLCLACLPSRTAESVATVIGPEKASPLQAYTTQEAVRVFGEHLKVKVEVKKVRALPPSNAIIVGTARGNPLIAQLIKQGFLEPESREQGYSMRCAPHPKNPKAWLLAMTGADDHGVLYGLRDLEHFELKNFKVSDSRVSVAPFARRDYPRIQYRGHWVWGCNMPDKKAWMENMSRWKMNELIHWDNYPPKKAREYVEFAHSRGIRVIWGFGWGWEPTWNFTLPENFNKGTGRGVHMCGSDPKNRAFFKREILRKIREEYVPTGCDGIYFQSFTEVPKCRCQDCGAKSKGQIMLEFVNPIVDAIKKEFPDLWVSCGIHANLGKYSELKNLDSRCNIYWENCPSGVSVRGDDEDFGYINKTLPYSHGFSKTCPADPAYTEESLQKWMNGNARRYALRGDMNTYVRYMEGLQRWAGGMTKKPKAIKHGSTVADHSVFCRRTPYMHVALAEAMWNPSRNTPSTAEGIVAFLDANGGVPGLIAAGERAALKAVAIAQHDAVGKKVILATAYSPKYRGGGDQALTDGKRASAADCKDPAWQGYHRQNLDAVVDLGKPLSINALSVGFLQQQRVGVYLPDEVKFAVSYDGKTFEEIGTAKAPERVEGDQRRAYRIDGLDLYKVRQLRVRASYVREWLFVDEVMINPAGQK